MIIFTKDGIELNQNDVKIYEHRGIIYEKLGLEYSTQNDFEMYKELTQKFQLENF